MLSPQIMSLHLSESIPSLLKKLTLTNTLYECLKDKPKYHRIKKQLDKYNIELKQKETIFKKKYTELLPITSVAYVVHNLIVFNVCPSQREVILSQTPSYYRVIQEALDKGEEVQPILNFLNKLCQS